MKNISILFLILAFCACQTRPLLTEKLSYHIHSEIDSAGKISTTSFVRIAIKDQEKLFSGSWKLYFNSYKHPEIGSTDSARFGITHVNGDFYYVYPKNDLHLDTKSTTLEIPIKQAYLKNISDYPVGFFLVQDTEPDKYYTLENSDPMYEQIVVSENKLAAQLYDQNIKTADIDSKDIFPLLPTPQHVEKLTGNFTFNKDVILIADASYTKLASQFAKQLKTLLGMELAVSNDTQKKGIRFIQADMPNEAYILNIQPEEVSLQAGGEAGFFYALQSLQNLILSSFNDQIATIPAVKISDAPRFAHRALMLDVARNFQSKERVLELLDIMANYKINILHFHFNDDEGWRIAIKGLEELTDYGAKRGYSARFEDHLYPAHGSGPDLTNNFGSGYYTREDFIEILQYAAARHIQVIPEIETPGHARAAIKSMDYRYKKYSTTDSTKAKAFLLHDPADASQYKTVQGWNDDAINVAMPSVYTFLDHVIADLASIYKEAGLDLKTVHMGGDEVPAGVWEKSPAVNDLLRAKNFRSADDLWVYYFAEAHKILNKYNIRMHGWEEIGMKRVDLNGKKKMEIVPSLQANNYLMDVWNNVYGTGSEDLAYRLANEGFKIVLSNVTNMYMDLAANRSFYESGMFWGGYIDEEKLFNFIPQNYFKTFYYDDTDSPINPAAFNDKVKLSEQGLANIQGLQTAIWGETLIHEESLYHMIFPKLIAFAERAWAPSPSWSEINDNTAFKQSYETSWRTFSNQLYKEELPKLNRYHPHIAYRIPTPGVKIENDKLWANTRNGQLEIYYHTEHPPTTKDHKYTGPIQGKGKHYFKAYDPQSKRYSRLIVVEL